VGCLEILNDVKRLNTCVGLETIFLGKIPLDSKSRIKRLDAGKVLKFK
jgi:hypothetical protein